MPNFVTAGVCTDISSAGFCLAVEALWLPQPGFSTVSLRPQTANTSSKGKKSPVFLSKGFPSPEIFGLNLIPLGLSNSLKYVFSCFNLFCFSDFVCVCVCVCVESLWCLEDFCFAQKQKFSKCVFKFTGGRVLTFLPQNFIRLYQAGPTSQPTNK